MKGIRIDPARRTVRAETGLKLGEFDRETQAFGLATTLGVVSTTGIAGLTLGGGWGHLQARYGLAIDNVISADVVTADGRLLTANDSENQDLFWGARGGSANFGIVFGVSSLRSAPTNWLPKAVPFIFRMVFPYLALPHATVDRFRRARRC